MTKVVRRPLPHAVSTAAVRDPEARRALMLLAENMAALARMLAEAQSAVEELQRKGGR